VQLEQMGERGRQYMLSQRSWDAIARDTEAVYASLGANPSANKSNVKQEPLVALAGAEHGGR
jgi:hypothetical protein